MEQRHSRVPLYREEKDDVIGIIHLKDVLIHQEALRKGTETLLSIVRPALFVPDSLSIDEMLIKFQKTKQHMAVIIDEFGAVQGLVTLSDLIEEIIGEIQDEYDDEDRQDYYMINDGDVMLKGGMPISDLNRMFNLNIVTQDNDTIAGYIIEQLGYIPQQSSQELVVDKDFTLTVVEATGTRIETVLMKLTKPSNEAGENGDRE